jgi:metal-responsive CopG/Arc/MetJ family transcriptional regulator
VKNKMTKTTSITLPDEVFNLVDDIRGRIPRSIFVSDIINGFITNYKLEEKDPNEIERVYIDFDEQTTVDFERLLKFYEEYSMHGITQAKFFKKIYIMGTRSMKIFMNNKLENMKEREIINYKDESLD